jgi:hypothetical protein
MEDKEMKNVLLLTSFVVLPLLAFTLGSNLGSLRRRHQKFNQYSC